MRQVPVCRREIVAAGGVAGVGLLAGCLSLIDKWRHDPEFVFEEIENKTKLFEDTGLIPIYVIVSNDGVVSGLAQVVVRVYDADDTFVGSGVGQAKIAPGTRYRIPVVVDIHSESGEDIDVEITHRS